MNVTITINDLILYLAALFSAFSPFAVIGPYAALTSEYKRKIQIKMAIRIGLITAITLILLSLIGNIILEVLGISLASLSAAGGLVLIVTSLNMVIKGDSPRRKVKPGDIDDDDDDWQSMIVTPLLFPMTFGAVTISLVMTQSGQAVTLVDKLLLCGVLAVHGLVVFLVYFFASTLTEKIGNKGSAVMTRVGGIILLSLAFMIFSKGLLELLPGLAG
ncbi:MAG: MarC family protein [Spirochaetales bacterium]|nr:MarC family protein [Spirochaetales bacterium]